MSTKKTHIHEKITLNLEVGETQTTTTPNNKNNKPALNSITPSQQKNQPIAPSQQKNQPNTPSQQKSQPNSAVVRYNIPIMTLLLFIVVQKSIFGAPSYDDLLSFLHSASNYCNNYLITLLQQSKSSDLDQLLVLIMKSTVVTNDSDIFSYNKTLNGSLYSIISIHNNFGTYSRGQGKSNPDIPSPYVLQLHMKSGVEGYEELPDVSIRSLHSNNTNNNDNSNNTNNNGNNNNNNNNNTNSDNTNNNNTNSDNTNNNDTNNNDNNNNTNSTTQSTKKNKRNTINSTTEGDSMVDNSPSSPTTTIPQDNILNESNGLNQQSIVTQQTNQYVAEALIKHVWDFEQKHFAKSHIIPYKLLETTTIKAIELTLFHILALCYVYYKALAILNYKSTVDSDQTNGPNSISTVDSDQTNGPSSILITNIDNSHQNCDKTIKNNDKFDHINSNTAKNECGGINNENNFDKCSGASGGVSTTEVNSNAKFVQGIENQLTADNLMKLLCKNIHDALRQYFPKGKTKQEEQFKVDLKSICQKIISNLFFDEHGDEISSLFHVTNFVKNNSPKKIIEKFINDPQYWQHTYYSASHRVNAINNNDKTTTIMSPNPKATPRTTRSTTKTANLTDSNLANSLNLGSNLTDSNLANLGSNLANSNPTTPLKADNLTPINNIDSDKFTTPTVTSAKIKRANATTPASNVDGVMSPTSKIKLQTSKRTIIADLFDLINNHPLNILSGHIYTNLVIKNRVDVSTMAQTQSTPIPHLANNITFNRSLIPTFKSVLQLQNNYIQTLTYLKAPTLTRSLTSDISKQIKDIKSSMAMYRYDVVPIIWPYECEQYGGKRYTTPLLHQWDIDEKNKKKVRVRTQLVQLDFTKNVYVLSSIFHRDSTQAMTMYYHTGTNDFDDSNDSITLDGVLYATSNNTTSVSVSPIKSTTPTRRRSGFNSDHNNSSATKSKAKQIQEEKQKLKIVENDEQKLIYFIAVPLSIPSTGKNDGVGDSNIIINNINTNSEGNDTVIVKGCDETCMVSGSIIHHNNNDDIALNCHNSKCKSDNINNNPEQFGEPFSLDEPDFLPSNEQNITPTSTNSTEISPDVTLDPKSVKQTTPSRQRKKDTTTTTTTTPKKSKVPSNGLPTVPEIDVVGIQTAVPEVVDDLPSAPTLEEQV